MALRRYRSIEEAGRATWRDQNDPVLLLEIRDLWRLGSWLAPWRLPVGVHRFRSIDALNRQRQEWEREHVVPRFQPVREGQDSSGP